jgi:four helix bundle protein
VISSKLRVCLKELRETRAWLKFVERFNGSAVDDVGATLTECDELLAILATSVRTATRQQA